MELVTRATATSEDVALNEVVALVKERVQEDAALVSMQERNLEVVTDN